MTFSPRIGITVLLGYGASIGRSPTFCKHPKSKQHLCQKGTHHALRHVRRPARGRQTPTVYHGPDYRETHPAGRSGGARRASPTRCRSTATVFVCRAPWRLYYVEFSYRARHGELDSDRGSSAGVRPLLHRHRPEREVFVFGILPGWQSRRTSHRQRRDSVRSASRMA